MRYIKNRQLGFTFIEMTIVCIMLSFISLAVYATFNSGIKIWQKINQSIPIEDVDIFLDKFVLDLNNGFEFSDVGFLGAGERIELATLVDSQRLGKRTIGKVIYSYNREAETADREQRDFSQIYSGEEGAITQSINNIKSLSFKYYIYDLDKQQYLWEDEWLKGELPLAVRMELEFDNGAEIHKFTRTVSIPVNS